LKAARLLPISVPTTLILIKVPIFARDPFHRTIKFNVFVVLKERYSSYSADLNSKYLNDVFNPNGTNAHPSG
jgi:hypothetical protein